MLILIKNIKKGVRNLRFLTTLVPRRHVTATCLIIIAICLPLRQLALYNFHLLLFPTLATLLLWLLSIYNWHNQTWFIKQTYNILHIFYLFLLAQQVETEHKTTICRTLQQSTTSAILCQDHYPNYHKAAICRNLQQSTASAKTTTQITTSPTPSWPNLQLIYIEYLY